MLTISVDPGLTGAISLLCSQRGLLECEDLPTCSNGQSTGKMLRWIDCDKLQKLLAEWSSDWRFAEESVHAVIERPIPMPSMPSTTTASSFDSFGVIRALVSGKVTPNGMTIVTPREWKKFFGLGTDKDESIACALRLYPSAARYLTKKLHHNRAESILVGHFLLREVA
jgi:hypothetical protein